ncbi:hypothetical protein N752_16560 [Desulforamulus aquiferis]|nr:hypothetical protein [Desulforamulus aquiferis]RYD04001.1 hypothetical protein N752_16560 [Desulforamulus aquiferis]
MKGRAEGQFFPDETNQAEFAAIVNRCLDTVSLAHSYEKQLEPSAE